MYANSEIFSKMFEFDISATKTKPKQHKYHSMLEKPFQNDNHFMVTQQI